LLDRVDAAHDAHKNSLVNIAIPRQIHNVDAAVQNRQKETFRLTKNDLKLNYAFPQVLQSIFELLLGAEWHYYVTSSRVHQVKLC